MIVPKYNNFKQERIIGGLGGSPAYTIYLPDPPDLRCISGHNLPKEKQKFQVTPLPKDIKQWDIKSREEFEAAEWKKRQEGYFWMNNGNIEYMTGTNYMYCNWWHLDVGLPSFGDADQEWFLFWDYVKKNPKARGMIFLSNRREGKALSINTDIPTLNGWKKMNDIQVGDEVFGSDGKPTKVTYISDVMFNHTCYNVKFSDGSSIIADEEHLWIAYDKNTRVKSNTNANVLPRTVTTLQMKNSLKISGENNWSVKNTKPVEYKKIKLKIPPYILGLWLGDGGSVSASITNIDQEIIDAWIEYGNTIGLKTIIRDEINYFFINEQDGTHETKYKINSFRQFLKDYNLIDNKHIPKDYLESSSEDRFELLKGLMDTDGCRSGKKSTCEYCSKSETLINHMYELLCSLGYKSRITTKINKRYNRKYYYLRFHHNGIPPFKLKRKVEKCILNDIKDRGWRADHRYIVAIEEIPSVPVKCIAVDNEDHGYLCSKSFIVTHNTYKAICAMYDEISKTPDSAGGIQSKNLEDAKKVFNKLIAGWRKLPYFFRPVDIGDSYPKSKLDFSEPGRRNTKSQDKEYSRVLNSYIDYENAKEEAYDGMKQLVNIQDEIGKCLAKGTPVLMFDGTVKTVENVKKGELLMGDDSKKRKVVSITTGEEMMYRIVPKKGMEWGCNESHILSLKVCSDNMVPKHKKGDTLNISVKDFLQLSKTAQRHLMLYRVGVEYKKASTTISPYLLGLWLGDGNNRNTGITNEDHEVVSYLKQWCIDNYLHLRISKNVYYITTQCNGSSKNVFLNQLNKSGLLKNKHIPDEYMINSSFVRLRLLAGFIDADGHLTKIGNRQNFEITQKRKILAEQICTLANSLGFYASINKKVASMKRKDGTVYLCDVYRVSIFGEIHKIPCLIKRKQAKKITNKHKNTRNPLRTGFKVIPCGKGQYYGFAIDKNHLFLLGDYTVTHNTVEVDVDARHKIVKECVMDSARIIGKIIATSTVEEMEKKGGENCQKLWNKSDPKKLLPNGQTHSGLLQLFKPAYYGFRGENEGEDFVDEYGYSNKEAAKKYIEENRNALTDRDDVVSDRRKYPFTVYDCFIKDSKKAVYDVAKVEQQIEFNRGLPENVLTRGNFIWKNGEKDTTVEFSHNNNGRWLVSWMPKPDDRNKILRKMGQKCPGNIDVGCFGLDPYDNKTTVDNRKSDAAAYGFRRFDPMAPRESGTFILEYVNRPKLPETMWEDMIMMCVFYGWEILIESNKIGTINHFRTRGYDKYLMYRPDETQTSSSVKMKEPGIPLSGQEARMSLIYATESYIINKVGLIEEEGEAPYYGKCYFTKLLENWRDFDFDKEWTEFDSMVGAGLAILGSRNKIQKKGEKKTFSMFPMFMVKGNKCERVEFKKPKK